MAHIVTLNDSFAVSGQVLAGDLDRLKAEGFSTIVCNRPDGESHNQPSAREIADAAKRCGMEFHHIPVGGSNPSTGYVDQMGNIMRAAPGKTLAFCRSGLRSALIWALASVKNGANREATIARVEAVGFPTRIIRTSLGDNASPAS